MFSIFRHIDVGDVSKILYTVRLAFEKHATDTGTAESRNPKSRCPAPRRPLGMHSRLNELGKSGTPVLHIARDESAWQRWQAALRFFRAIAGCLCFRAWMFAL